MKAALARIKRGYARMWAWVVDKAMRLIGRRRGHRFQTEQANLADQLSQTRTSLGLMAAAAQHSDDEHRRQALQTEQTLRERKRVLEANRKQRGLADEERWELESINRGLAELLATPETVGHMPMRAFGAVGQPGVLSRLMASLIPFFPYILIGGLLLSVTGWGNSVFQGWRADRLEGRAERAEQRLEEARNTITHYREREEEYREALADAREDRNEAIERTNRERAIAQRAQAQARRARLEMETASRERGEPIDWGLPVAGPGDGAGAAQPPAAGGDVRTR